MLDVLMGIIVVVVLFVLFQEPIGWLLNLIQDAVFSVLLFYAEGHTIEKIVLTIIVLWLVKKILRWFFR